MTNRVFVYGTLKSGYGNNRLLQTSKLIGKAVTNFSTLLTDCGFPYMVRPSEALVASHKAPLHPVVGEVYEVTDEAVMASLDRLEGVAYNHYNRETIEVNLDGVDVEVQTYFCGSVDNAIRLPVCPVDEEGNYKWSR